MLLTTYLNLRTVPNGFVCNMICLLLHFLYYQKMTPREKLNLTKNLNLMNPSLNLYQRVKILEVSNNIEDNDNMNIVDNIFHLVNSKSEDLYAINQLKPDKSSIRINHTNLASLYEYHEDLEIVLSVLKFDFNIIGTSAHKIRDIAPVANIDILGNHNVYKGLS